MLLRCVFLTLNAVCHNCRIKLYDNAIHGTSVFRLDPEGRCPDWSIVELQGELETKSEGMSLSEKFVGDLHYTKEVSPTRTPQWI